MPGARRRDITGLVLAGGRGLRMGGVDKGLQPFGGRPLVVHVVERLAPQVGRVLVSANRHAEQYAALGLHTVPDHDTDFAGPLAGIAAGLAACDTPWLACVPCDAPWLPLDLVDRLAAALDDADEPEPDLAVARSPGGLQPVFCLLHRRCGPALEAWLAAGGRKVGQWTTAQRHVEAAFGDTEAEAFANANTRAELDQLARPAPTPSNTATARR